MLEYSNEKYFITSGRHFHIRGLWLTQIEKAGLLQQSQETMEMYKNTHL